MTTGRVALVTGAGKGLGEAIAVALHAAGARLVLTGRDEAALARVVARLGGDGTVVSFVADVTDAAAMERGLDRAEELLGPIDILVANAGVALSAPLSRTSDEDFARVMDVNANAPFRLARRLVPKMAERGWGRFLPIASVAGLTGGAYTTAYAMSKHALVGLTRSVAAEYATKGVTANAVCPGFCDTEMTERSIATIVARTGRTAAEAKTILERLSPQARLVPPAEVGHIVAMLASDAASSVNGQTVTLNGG